MFLLKETNELIIEAQPRMWCDTQQKVLQSRTATLYKLWICRVWLPPCIEHLEKGKAPLSLVHQLAPPLINRHILYRVRHFFLKLECKWQEDNWPLKRQIWCQCNLNLSFIMLINLKYMCKLLHQYRSVLLHIMLACHYTIEGMCNKSLSYRKHWN